MACGPLSPIPADGNNANREAGGGSDDVGGEAHRSRVECLFRSHAVRLEAFARGFMRDADSAADVVQTVFARIVSRDIPTENERAWLYRVVHNECCTQLRRRKVDENARRQLTVPSEPFRLDCGESDEIERVLIAVRRLGGRDQTLLKARLVDGEPFRDISERTGESVSSLTTRYSRLIAKLRQSLAPPTGDT